MAPATFDEANRGMPGGCVDGSDAFCMYVEKRGLMQRLRKDLSGVAKVEIEGERATVITARGTRYAFRKRPNGIWGLTLFTAELVSERNRAERDLSVIRNAAADYDRARTRSAKP